MTQAFEDLVARSPKVPLTPTVPESAYFVVTEVRELDWLNYAIVRSALDWWGAEKVNMGASRGRAARANVVTGINAAKYDCERYGLHFWAFEAEGGSKRPIGVDLSPDMVRSIDTPLFCRMRKLFDNVDGYFSTTWQKNPNCTVSWSKDQRENTHRLFADYHFKDDTSDMKDEYCQKADHLKITCFPASTSRMGLESWYCADDLPAGEFNFRRWMERNRTGLLKIRMDYSGETVLSRTSDAFGLPQLKFEWIGNIVNTEEEYKGIEDTSWTSADGISLSASNVSELAILYDRRDTGKMLFYLDGKAISNRTLSLSLVASPKIAGEVWFDAREWNNDDLDTGFRETVYRLSIYADVVPPQALARACKA
ncbi:MAG: hypothetical protein ASARMPREDX12_005633 [Alectoria sarmentosa]|nr:MAG: hypothetical protein ASARMPREDX12_005633 [Alectoria sarmentosa]